MKFEYLQKPSLEKLAKGLVRLRVQDKKSKVLQNVVLMH